MSEEEHECVWLYRNEVWRGEIEHSEFSGTCISYGDDIPDYGSDYDRCVLEECRICGDRRLTPKNAIIKDMFNDDVAILAGYKYE